MNKTERELVKRLTGIDPQALRVRLAGTEGGREKKYNRRAGTVCMSSAPTRLLGGYRRMTAAKKRLDIKIRERLAFLERAQRECRSAPSWFCFGREKNALLEMIAEAEELEKRLALCKRLAEMTGGIEREAIEERFLNLSRKRMPDWAQTAQTVGFESSPEELCRRVTKALADAVKEINGECE